MGMFDVVVVTLWLLMPSSLLVDAASVNSVDPRQTSMNGGGRLIIDGQGFPGNAFSLTASGTGNEVQLVDSDGHTLTGVIHPDGCTATKIAFYTPEGMKRDVWYDVRVKVDGVTISSAQMCADNKDKCKVMATYYHTPRISSMVNQTGVPDVNIKIYGRIITTRYGANTQTTTNGIDSRITRVQTPGTCYLKNGEEYYNLTLVSETSVWGWMECKPKESFVGNANFTFLVEAPFGRSLADTNLLAVTHLGTTATYQFFTTINSLSHSSGSTQGGQNVTLAIPYAETAGRMSTYAEAQVFFGGIRCPNIHVVRDSGISFIVPEQPSSWTASTIYSGNRGVNVEYFNTPFSNEDEAATSTVATSGTEHFDSAKFCGHAINTKYTRTKGVFTPLENGTHVWKIKATNGGKLYFSGDGTGTAVATSYGGWARSQSFTATVGEKYAFTMVAKDGTNADACVQVGVENYDTKKSWRMSGWIKNEKQKLKFTSTVSVESLSIKFNDIGTSTANGVSEVQKLCLQDGASSKVRLGMYGVFTKPDSFTFGDTTDMTTALSALPCFQTGDTVTVASTTAASGTCVLVTIASPRGDYPLFTSDSTTVTVTEETQGVAFPMNVSFTMNDAVSPVFEYDSDNTVLTPRISAALTSMFSTRCPSVMAPDYDFEDPTNDDNVNSILAFCGQYSKKNKGTSLTLFEGVKTISIVKWMCFAMVNVTDNRLYVTYTTPSGIKKSWRRFSLTTILTTSMEEGGWNYTCVDIFSLMQTDSKETGNTFKLHKAWLSNGVDTTPFYADAVAFRRTNPIEGLTDISKMRLMPAYPNSNKFLINTVAVEYLADTATYKVDIDPLDCGNNFEPLAISGAQASGSGDSFTYSGPHGRSVVVTRLTAATPPTEGDFTLTYNGSTSNTMSATMSDNDLKSVLEGIKGMKTMDVTTSDDSTCHNRDVIISFEDEPGNLTLMTLGSKSFQPAGADATMEKYQSGRMEINPLTGDFVKTYHTTPQIVAKINNIWTRCDASSGCGYEYSTALTPTTTTINPASGNIGVTVTIAGTGFSTVSGENTVSIGPVPCDVTSQTATEIVCDLNNGPVGTAEVKVNVANKGFSTSISFTYTSGVMSVSPSTGGLAGGLPITLTGNGFSSMSTASVGSNDCPIQSYTNIEIVCILPASSDQSATSSVQATVAVSGGPDTVSFTYDPSSNPTITTVTHNLLSVTGGQTITIDGNEFGTATGTAFLGANELTVDSWSATSVVMTTPTPTIPGQDLLLSVVVPNVGWARQSGSRPTIDIGLVVNNISPVSGSMFGGTKVKLGGAGFGTNKDAVSAYVGDYPIEIDSVTNTLITGSVGSISTQYNINNMGQTGHGPYFAFNETYLDINEADAILFSWDAPEFVEVAEYTIMQTETITTKTQKPGSFEPPPKSRSGSFRWEVKEAGVYYLWSGPVNEDMKSDFRMTVNVTTRSPSLKPVTVMVSSQEARHAKAAGSNSGQSESCSPVTADMTDCTPASLTEEDSAKIYFHLSECRSPVINEVEVANVTMNPRAVIASSVLTIKGSGLANSDCANIASIGDCSCEVQSGSSTSEQFMCQLDSTCTVPPGQLVPVTASVLGYGDAHIRIPLTADRSCGFVPAVQSVSPSTGSTAGGTPVTVTGTHLASVTSVNFNGAAAQCDYGSDTLTCTTPVSTTGNVTLDTDIGAGVCSGSCLYTYSTAETPVVSSVTPTSVEGPTTLVIEGSLLPTVAADISVFIGDDGNSNNRRKRSTTQTNGTPCLNVQVNSATQLQCDVVAVPAGQNTVHVQVKNLGNAKTVTTVTGAATVTSIVPAEGSIHGGTVVKIGGHGFHGDTSVNVAGVAFCDAVTKTLTEITCTTKAASAGTVSVIVTSNGQTYPALSYTFSTDATPAISSVSPTTGIAGTLITIAGSHFSDTAADVTVTVGTSACDVKSASETSITCQLGSASSGDHNVLVHVVGKGKSNEDKVVTYEHSITSITPTSGNINGYQVMTVTGTGYTSATTVEICSKACKVDSFATTYLECITPPNTAGTACAVKVTEDGRSLTATDQYTYAATSVPVITGVTPNLGGTGGGTAITVAGSGFSDPMTVSIAGIPCAVTFVDATAIHCTTGAHSGTIASAVIATDSTGLRAVPQDPSNDDYRYVDRWSSTSTWGGQPLPAQDEMVVISAGLEVLLDMDTPILSMLLIDGGTLIFADGMDITLRAKNILLNNGGLLQVGTFDNPFNGLATIELYGHRSDPPLPRFGSKGIFVLSGVLELHGQPKTSWTKLGQTANAGATSIFLKEPVDNWTVGDELVLATTGGPTSQGETEVIEIASIAADRQTIGLKDPLVNKHLSVLETYSTPVGDEEFSFEAEVGNLHRNVRVMGSSHADWVEQIEACDAGFNAGEFAVQTCFEGRYGAENGSDEFGGQIMVSKSNPDDDQTNLRLSYVQLHRMGQAFLLGRYPVHFHMNGYMSWSYVIGCAIYNTNNRATNIHGSHNITISWNVIYNIKGAGFFLEDGVETNNNFICNLAVFVKSSTSLLNEDVTPAAFWITNPNNTYKCNSAAGGTHHGYWVRVQKHSEGPSSDDPTCPQKVPLKLFVNNTAHSLGKFGFWTFEDYYPMKDGGCNTWDDPAPAVIDRFRTWNNEKGVEVVNGGYIVFNQLIGVANGKACIEHKLNKHVPKGDGTIAGIKDSYCAGRSISDEVFAAANLGNERGAVVLGFGEGHSVENMVFSRYADIPAFKGTSIDGTCKTLCNGETVTLKNITLIESNVKALFRWQNEFAMRFESPTGPIGTLLAETGGLPATCTAASDFDQNGVKAVMCPHSMKFHKFACNNLTPSSLRYKNVTFTNEFGSLIGAYAEKRIFLKGGNVAMPLSNQTYKVEWGSEAQTNRSYTGRISDVKEYDCLIIGHRMLAKPDVVSLDGGVTNGKYWSTPFDCVNNFAALTLGDWYYHESFIYVAYVQAGHSFTAVNAQTWPQKSSENIEFEFSAYKCFFKDCITPPEPDTIPPVDSRPDPYWIWSNQIWSEGAEFVTDENAASSVLPQEGDDVKIPADGINWVVIKDVSPPPLRLLKLLGVLEIDYAAASSADLTYELRVTYLVIIGGRLVAGWPENPMLQPLLITLAGDANTPTLTIPEIENPIIPRGIAAFGGIDLHGKNVGDTWVQLTQTASAGSTELYVTPNRIAHWKIGYNVIITSTSNNPDETEERTIAALNSAQGKITLTAALQYKHTGYVEGTKYGNVNFGAAVSLVNRTVKIQGSNSFVKISLTEYDGYTRTGWGRFSYTEFHRMGQEPFSISTDPRMPLAFAAVGDVSETKPSKVFGNSFYDSSSTAIGAFDIGNLNISDNTVYRFVGHGIVTNSRNTTISRNLVSNQLWTGSWNGRAEAFNFRYEGAIMATDSTDLKLMKNFVAASQRIGYRVPGEDCSSSTTNYDQNYASGCLLNVGILPEDNIGDIGTCTRFSGFISAKAKDYGFFFEGKGNVELKDSVFAENQVGVIIIIIGPPALSHVCGSEKTELTNVTVIGHFTNSDCTGETTPSGTYLDLSSKCRGLRTTDGGRIGLLYPTYHSASNNAMEKPCANDMAYNAICGESVFKDSTFINIGPHSTCGASYAISTNGAVDDAHHPMSITNSNMTNVNDAFRMHFYDANKGLINPSDCIDFDCDGLKQTFLFDTDGSFWGKTGATTSFPKRLYWDDPSHPERGLGTYRIPKAQLSKPDGSKYELADVAANGVGIPHDGTCVLKNPSGGVPMYQCESTKYRQLVIESMDIDTERRRLSPVSVLSESGYIDLINGPQDHGWCSGYTCQLRISTFTAVITTGQSTKIYLSSTQPKVMKYFVQDAADTDCSLLIVYYHDINRIDLYNSTGSTTASVLPKNAYLDNGAVKYNFDPNANYIPSCSDNHGTNFVDRDNKLIYLVLKGRNRVELKKTELILVSFRLPQMSEEDFFGPAIVSNLALFLNVPFDKIRLVNVVPDNVSRRRRSTSVGGLTITVEVGDQPTSTITGTIDPPIEEAAALMTGCQTGTMGDALGTEVGDCGSIILGGYEYVPVVPVELRFEVSPTAQHEGVPFATQPKIRAYDSNGEVIQDLGIAEHPWQITATLRSGSGHASATLSGTTTLSSASGWFNFTDLVISHAGSGYIIDFDISDPAGSNLTTSVTMDVDPLPMTVGVHSMTTADIEQGSIFAINFDLRDSTTNEVIPDITWRGHTFAVTCDEVMHSGNLTGTFTNSFSTSTGRVEFDDWTYASYGFIYVTCRIVSTPAEYDFETYHEVVILSHNQMAIPIERTENVVVRFNVDYHTTLPNQGAVAQLHQATLQFLGLDNPDIIIRSSTITEGSIVITFTMEGASSNVTDALANICSSISSGAVVTVGSTSLQLDGYMTVDGSNYYASCGQTSDEDEGLHPGYIALIVVVCLIILAAIILLVVWFICIKPKKKIHGRRWEVQEFADNGRTVFLAGGTNKMPGSFAPINTSLFEHGDKAGLRQTPLPVKNNGGLTPEQTMMNLRKQNTNMSIGQQGDMSRAVTPTSK